MPSGPTEGPFPVQSLPILPEPLGRQPSAGNAQVGVDGCPRMKSRVILFRPVDVEDPDQLIPIIGGVVEVGLEVQITLFGMAAARLEEGIGTTAGLVVPGTSTVPLNVDFGDGGLQAGQVNDDVLVVVGGPCHGPDEIAPILTDPGRSKREQVALLEGGQGRDCTPRRRSPGPGERFPFPQAKPPEPFSRPAGIEQPIALWCHGLHSPDAPPRLRREPCGPFPSTSARSSAWAIAPSQAVTQLQDTSKQVIEQNFLTGVLQPAHYSRQNSYTLRGHE